MSGLWLPSCVAIDLKHPMADTEPDSSSRQADFQDILNQASNEAADSARVRADVASRVPQVTRKRTVTGALAVAVPVLALLVAINVFDVPILDLLTPTPSPAVARRQSQEALDAMVKEIEGFREDYEELPERLAEVALPSQGTWTYSRTPGGHYQVALELHGQVVTFDSAEGKK